jgi:hypothetical protein
MSKKYRKTFSIYKKLFEASSCFREVIQRFPVFLVICFSNQQLSFEQNPSPKITYNLPPQSLPSKPFPPQSSFQNIFPQSSTSAT